MQDSQPTLYSIASGQPFLVCLAKTLIDEETRHALFGACALDVFTLLVPTRRAARELSQIFLTEILDTASQKEKTGGVLMPHITPIGDIDEEAFATDMLITQGIGLDLPPEIEPHERHLRLLRLVRAWAEKIGQPLDAVRLAGLAFELEDFLDEVQNENVDLSLLPKLVPHELAENWQKTLEFLAIVTKAWPEFLAEEGHIDRTERRNRILRTQAKNWAVRPPAGPVLAAGSTGSLPATADLLKTIAHLPRGAVVLPGFDMAADDALWRVIEKSPTHPQYMLARLLNHIGAPRDGVGDWPMPDSQANNQAKKNTRQKARVALLNQAMIPAEQTGHWAHSRMAADDLKKALAGLSVLHAPDQRSEAGAIAVAMRAILETPHGKAALVTRDRQLARRVAAELKRWDIVVDDSAGQPLNHALAANLVRLVLAAIAENLAPVPLLALLKHPLVCLGQARGQHLRVVRALEILALRGARLAPSIAALRAAYKNTTDKNAPDINCLLDRLEAAMGDLLVGDKPLELADLIAKLTSALEHITSDNDAPAPDFWFAREDGRALAHFFDGLLKNAAHASPAPIRDWAALLDLWMARQSLRRPNQHPRLFIWGTLEARLMQADLMILGGLNETSWPPMPDSGAWLSRQMRAELGLAAPERQIGQAAHDFIQAASAPKIMITRAAKKDGAPSTAARWLRRLATLCGDLPTGEAQHYLAWWQGLDAANKIAQPAQPPIFSPAQPPIFSPALPPRPCPKVAMRPRQLSVTQIETLLRDPYKIYAQKILGLRELDDIDVPPAPTHRGSLLHKLFENLLREPLAENEDIAKKLMALAETAAQQNPTNAQILQLWHARLQAMGDWFSAFEAQRRGQIAKTFVEVKGEMTLNLPDGDFTITAKADRIDLLNNGRLAIFDYKTGAPPTTKDVENHLAVQMTLQAAIAQSGGFADIKAAPVAELAYLQLTGGTPPGKYQPVATDRDLIDGAVAMVRHLVAAYGDEAHPYLSHIRPASFRGYTQFDHLARVREWQQDQSAGAST